MTVAEAIAAIAGAWGAASPYPGLEGLVAGRGDGDLTGVATCASPSIDVLERAAKSGCNLVLADGHPFYAYDRMWSTLPGTPEALAGSPLVAHKRTLIAEAGLTVARLKSAWDARFPAVAADGLARACGYPPDRRDGDSVSAAIPPQGVRAVAARIAGHGIRLIGDPDLVVRRAAFADGLVSPAKLGRILRDPAIDLVVAGEVIEWEAGPYMQDVRTNGRRAALMLIGFAASQTALPEAMAGAVRQVLPGVKVTAWQSPDPIWAAPKALRA
jgi:hypothetical protein